MSADEARRLAQLGGSLDEASSDHVLLLLADFTELPCTDAIYMLVRRPAPPGALHQGGGTPRGVSRERWPARDGEPMQHLFTLDLAAMPALAPWFGATRAVACFMHDVSGEQRDRYGELDIEWVTITEPTAPLDAPPAPPLDRFDFAVVPALVPHEVWRTPSIYPTPGRGERETVDAGTEYKLAKLSSAIYGLSARAGGESLEMHDPDPAPLIIQFDEAFVDGINLGDAGLAYLYSLTYASWQSH